MGNLTGFNANNVEPTQAFEPLPNGVYDAVLIRSELKPNKKGNGNNLHLTFQILSGKYQNRKLWDVLCVDNPSAQARQIAQGHLSAICRAVGNHTPNDSSELHDKPLKIVVKCVKQDDGSYQNEISGYRARHEGGPATNGSPTTQPTQQATVSQMTTQLMTTPSSGGAPRNPFQR